MVVHNMKTPPVQSWFSRKWPKTNRRTSPLQWAKRKGNRYIHIRIQPFFRIKYGTTSKTSPYLFSDNSGTNNYNNHPKHLSPNGSISNNPIAFQHVQTCKLCFKSSIYIYISYISADPSPFSRGRRKEWRRRRVGLLVVDVLLIPCALSWRRSGVWLCRIHCQEAAALGLFGVGCVTFSVYVGGLVSSLLGVPKLHFGTLRRTDFGTLRRMVFCFVWGRI